MKAAAKVILVLTALLSTNVFANCHRVMKDGVYWEYTRMGDGKTYGPHKIEIEHREDTNGVKQWGEYRDSEGNWQDIYIFNKYEEFSGHIRAGGRKVVFKGTCGSSSARGTMYYFDNPDSSRHKFKVTFFRM